jgi:ankyrin repeat protein
MLNISQIQPLLFDYMQSTLNSIAADLYHSLRFRLTIVGTSFEEKQKILKMCVCSEWSKKEDPKTFQRLLVIVDLLLQQDQRLINATFRQAARMTLLHFALQEGAAAMAQALIARGASTELIASNNRTALYFALEGGALSMICLFLSPEPTHEEQDLVIKFLVRHIEKWRIAWEDEKLKQLLTFLIEYSAATQKRFQLVKTYMQCDPLSVEETVKACDADAGYKICSPTNRSYWFVTLLGWAVWHNLIEITRFLLRCGADVEYGLSRTPLDLAISQENPEMIGLLLQWGACIDEEHMKLSINKDNTPILERFLQAGAKIERVGLFVSMLYIAVEENRLGAAECLLQWGAEADEICFGYGYLSFLDDIPATSLQVAASLGNDGLSMVRLLLSYGADPKVRNSPDRYAALDIARRRPDQRQMIELLESCTTIQQTRWAEFSLKDPVRKTPLHRAAEQGDTAECKRLLAENLENIEARTSGTRYTPLHSAIIAGDHVETCRVLIVAGADITDQDAEGNDPLRLAAINKREKVCCLLLELGADINARPMLLPSELKFNRTERTSSIVVESDIIQARKAKLTVLEQVARDYDNRYNICEILLFKSTNKVEAGVIKNSLFYATQKYNIGMIKILLAVCERQNIDLAKLDIPEQRHYLHLLAGAPKIFPDIFHLLLDVGCNINAIAPNISRSYNSRVHAENGSIVDDTENVTCLTPLHVAILDKRSETAIFLIRHGANPNIAVSDGSTALHLAISMGLSDVAMFMINHMASASAGVSTAGLFSAGSVAQGTGGAAAANPNEYEM